MKEILLNRERPDEIRQIDELKQELLNIFNWLKPIIPHYSNFTKAGKEPWKEGVWEARTKLINNFPNVASPFKRSDFISLELKQQFANFCSRNTIKCDLERFIKQLENFISHKGTDKYGAILIYSEADKLVSALEKFKVWVLNPRNLKITGEKQPEPPRKPKKK